MTSVRIVKSRLTGYSSFRVSGHSGYADEGSDIVCACISGVTELTIGILEKFSVDIRLNIRKDTADILCTVTDTVNNAEKIADITRIVGGFADYINSVADEYPDYIKCVITQE